MVTTKSVPSSPIPTIFEVKAQPHVRGPELQMYFCAGSPESARAKAMRFLRDQSISPVSMYIHPYPVLPVKLKAQPGIFWEAWRHAVHAGERDTQQLLSGYAVRTFGRDPFTLSTLFQEGKM